MIKPGSQERDNGLKKKKKLVIFCEKKHKKTKIKRIKGVVRIPLGQAIVVGPFQSKCVIPPFRVA